MPNPLFSCGSLLVWGWELGLWQYVAPGADGRRGAGVVSYSRMISGQRGGGEEARGEGSGGHRHGRSIGSTVSGGFSLAAHALVPRPAASFDRRVSGIARPGDPRGARALSAGLLPRRNVTCESGHGLFATHVICWARMLRFTGPR